MTRFDAMYKIVNFGRQEEKKLIAEGKNHEAYQIEHSRNILIYFLNENPIKKVVEKIERMTSNAINDNNYIDFVADELTRNLLLKLKKEFINK